MAAGVGDVGGGGAGNRFLWKEIDGERFRVDGGCVGGGDLWRRGAGGWHFLWLTCFWV